MGRTVIGALGSGAGLGEYLSTPLPEDSNCPSLSRGVDVSLGERRRRPNGSEAASIGSYDPRGLPSQLDRGQQPRQSSIAKPALVVARPEPRRQLLRIAQKFKQTGEATMRARPG